MSESVTTTQTTQENDPPTEVLMAQSQADTQVETQTRRATTPKGREGTAKTGISGKARRMSRSLAERIERTPFGGSSQPAVTDFKDNINPFVKKGLRRSPPTGSQQLQAEPPSEDPFANPFKKTGLRRSPVSSQATASQPTGSADGARSEVAKVGFRSSPVFPLAVENAEDVQLQAQTGRVERSPTVPQIVTSIEENNIQLLSGFGVPIGGRRSSSVLPLPEENIEDIQSMVAETIQQSNRADATSSARSPVGSMIVDSVETNAVEFQAIRSELPGPRRSSRLSQSPLLFGEKVGDASTLQQSPVLQRNIQQTPDTEVQVEEQAGAQLAAELQHSAITSEPAEVVESHTPTSEPPNRPAHYATTELLRPTSRHGQESQRRSPRPISSPTHTIRPPPHSRAEEFVNPFFTRRHEEPELPPTPTQRGILDPVVTTPPSGIHDTPNKRAQRRKAFDNKHKLSPLKPKEKRPRDVSSDTNSQARAKSQPPEVVAKEVTRRRRSSRFIAPVDIHAARKQKRDDLLRQLQQLQADVALANQENERVRLLGEAKKRPLGIAPNADELLAMLLRSTVPEPSSKPEPAKTSVLKSMDAFLPFRPRRKSVSAPIIEKPLPSHLPIALDDPLPYLQAFSPLSYTSTMTLVPTGPPASETSSSDTRQSLQKYVINASHPSGMFAARLAMIADSEYMAIKTIDVLRLDMGAEVELGTFIRDRASASGPLGKDITVICWAMSRWVEVSLKRARFWCAVENEFGDPEAQTAALQKTKKRKRSDGGNEDDEDERKLWTRRQLLPNIGRTSMVVAGKNVELRLEWKLGFDFTGEVESNLTADARIPVECECRVNDRLLLHMLIIQGQGLDDRNSLAKVPDTFSRLVKDKGPLSAVRALVGLMLV